MPSSSDHPVYYSWILIDLIVFYLSSIPSRNYDVSIPGDETNEENILQALFKKAHLSVVQNCKPIGEPKVSRWGDVWKKNLILILMINRLMRNFIYSIN